MLRTEQARYDVTLSGLNIVTRPLRVGEADLLTGREHANLIVKGAAGHVLFRSVPSAPWTHAALLSLLSREDVVRLVQSEGYGDAYLGDRWVGSTEV